MSLITLAKALAHLRVDSDDDLEYVADILEVAESHVAQYLGRPLNPWNALVPAEATPAEVKHGVLLVLTDLYTNRASQVDKPLTLNATLDRLLHFHRLGLGI